MAYDHKSTREVSSVEFPGVVFTLFKMTQKRRRELRETVAPFMERVRAIIQIQEELAKVEFGNRDVKLWQQLDTEFEVLMTDKIDPAYIAWGVKAIDGFKIDGTTVTIQESDTWPSNLYAEAVRFVKLEAELDGSERKNSELPTTSGEQDPEIQKPLTAKSAEEKDSGVIEIVPSITRTM